MTPKPAAVKTILIVDDDLGFIMWLGSTLAEAGYQPLPATSGKAAIALIKKLKIEIDLLMANLGGSDYPALIAYLTSGGKPPKIVALTQGEIAVTEMVQGVVRKPGINEPLQEGVYLQTVRNVLASTEKSKPAGPK